MKLKREIEIECDDDGVHCGPCEYQSDVGYSCDLFNVRLAFDYDTPGWGTAYELRCAECLNGGK